MKTTTWIRTLAGILGFFAVGHTLGTAAPHVRHGPAEAAVFEAMQGFRFPIMGFDRTYWEFYRGFALTIGLLLLILAIMAWQLGAVSQRDPNGALPMAITLQLACIGILVLSWMFFFGGPLVMSALAVACASVVVLRLRRDARRSAVRE